MSCLVRNVRPFLVLSVFVLALVLLIIKVQPGLSQSALALVYARETSGFLDPGLFGLGGRSDIFASAEDGSGEVRLSGNGPGWDSVPGYRDFPKWSWDKSKVAFVATTNLLTDLFALQSTDIWIMNSDGTNPRRVTDNLVIDVQPDFAPDGSGLLLVAGQYDERGQPDLFRFSTDLVLIDPATGRVVKKLSGAGADPPDPNGVDATEIDARYYRDGRIAFTSDRTDSERDTDNHQVFIRETNGKIWRIRLAPPYSAYRATDPAWSPDGNQIVFSLYQRESNPFLGLLVTDISGWDLFRVEVPPTPAGDVSQEVTPVPLTTSNAVNVIPVWSPREMQKIVYLSLGGFGSTLDLWTLNPLSQTPTPTRLTSNKQIGYVDWK